MNFFDVSPVKPTVACSRNFTHLDVQPCAFLLRREAGTDRTPEPTSLASNPQPLSTTSYGLTTRDTLKLASVQFLVLNPQPSAYLRDCYHDTCKIRPAATYRSRTDDDENMLSLLQYESSAPFLRARLLLTIRHNPTAPRWTSSFSSGRMRADL